MSEFFKSFRKQGFLMTLQTLEKFKDKCATEQEFFQALKENNSYLNEFYRVKKELLKFGLISYKLNSDYDKVIFLTEKGSDVLEKIRDIDTILINKDEDVLSS